jgi:hypothetical protein
MATNKNDEILIGLVFDAMTGESFERELTSEEIAARQQMKAEAEKSEAEAEAAQIARDASIRKMAEASGLTEAEIEALF